MLIDSWNEIIAIYILPIILFLLYIFLNWRTLDTWMATGVPTYYGRVYIKALVFTLILYLVMLLILNVWHNKCTIDEEDKEEIQEVIYG